MFDLCVKCAQKPPDGMKKLSGGYLNLPNERSEW